MDKVKNEEGSTTSAVGGQVDPVVRLHDSFIAEVEKEEHAVNVCVAYKDKDTYKSGIKEGLRLAKIIIREEATKSPMIVNVETIYQLKSELTDINLAILEDIEFYENGEKIDIPKEYIEEWSFIGLSNCDFITTEFYKHGKSEI